MTVNEFVGVVATLISIIYTHPYLQSRLRFGHRQRQVRKDLRSFTNENKGVFLPEFFHQPAVNNP